MSQSADSLEARRSDPVLDRLKSLHPKVIDLSLDRVHRLLGRLGHPERSPVPVVHVAGTNGKGSTIAFLRAFLEAAGWRVHVYTSPHLVHFRERIRLAGTLIEDARLAALLEECERANGGEPITFFEVTTCAAFLAFRRTPADVLLLETGLGGRLDATNVIDRPAVTAITRVSYDHMQFLGGTLTGIAGEKAGILKPGVPVVVAPQMAEADDAIVRRAVEVGAPLLAFGSAWRVDPLADGFRFESGSRRLDLPRPGLAGAHQMINAGTALACLDHLPGAAPGGGGGEGAPVDEAAIRRGLAEVDWPGRLQRLTRGPLVDRLPGGWELWLDGGHNDSAGEVLAAQAAAWRAQSDKPLFLVFGMLATKQPRDFLEPLVPYAERMRTVAIPGEEAGLPAQDAAAAARAAGIADSRPAPDIQAAVGQLLEAAVPADRRAARILICGSLYLAGTILSGHG